MLQLVFLLIIAIIMIAGAPALPERRRFLRIPLQGLGVLLILYGLGSTSFVFIGQDETGHMHKIYTGGSLSDGAILAVEGQKGPQARILAPGFHLIPLVNVLYNVTKFPVVEVPEDQYGYLVARDGVPLRPDQTYADAFEPDNASRMVNNAAHFLTEGGQKGPQTSVLTPGKYRLNSFLWDVAFGSATDIPTGFVGVIKSNVWSRVDFGNLKTDKPVDCKPSHDQVPVGGELAVPLVPVGCIGIWDRALSPGKYYINGRAYSVTLVDTRVQTWVYKGGYTRRFINLEVNQQGDITQTEGSENVSVPDGADEAIRAKVEGWDVPQELRVVVQVTPDNAPFVVASVGGLEEVRERILTPVIRAEVRNVAGGTIHAPAPVLNDAGEPVLDDTGSPTFKTLTRPARVLDLIENRSLLEDNVERIVHPEGLKAGVEIKEVRFGEPVIPPELLVARQREQLAQQLRKAYEEEQVAQTQRIAAEQARATADQQPQLVNAQIEVQRSEQFAIARENEGRGERNKLQLIAEGQSSQVNVLGEERVVELRKYELLVDRVFTLVEKEPQIVTTALANAHKFVPETVMSLGGDGGNNLAGAAGVLGAFLGQTKAERPAVPQQTPVPPAVDPALDR